MRKKGIRSVRTTCAHANKCPHCKSATAYLVDSVEKRDHCCWIVLRSNATNSTGTTEQTVTEALALDPCMNVMRWESESCSGGTPAVQSAE